MIYLSEMTDKRVRFYRELREAVEVYFDAPTNPMGKSDADTLMVIIQDHVEYFFPKHTDADSTSISDPGITLVEGEGINLAYSYEDALQSKLFESLSSDKRIELLEACIYALNTRLNNLEKGGEDDSGG